MTTQDENYEVTNDIIDQALANVHTIVVAKIVAVNATTIDVLPSMARVVEDEVIALPTFADVPPIAIQGGSSRLNMPLAVGDSCLLLISERCFDTWYIGQDGARPLEARMHDYSDGFALVGINPQASAIQIPNLIELMGDALMEGDHEHNGNLVRTGDVIINGDMEINGNLTVTGTIAAGNFTGLGGGALTSTADIISNGISLQTHVHGGVESGGSSTGKPT